MKLGDLRKSLRKFSADLDEIEIVMMGVDCDGNRTYDNMAFVGVIEKPVFCIALGSMDLVLKMEDDGTLKFKKDLE